LAAVVYFIEHHSGWPLVWKTWKCQGIWSMSGKCQGKNLAMEMCPKTGYCVPKH